MIELVDNGDETMSLVLTILDHAGPPNPGGARPSLDAKGNAGEGVLKLASIGREIAFNDYQADPQNDGGAKGSPLTATSSSCSTSPGPPGPNNPLTPTSL